MTKEEVYGIWRPEESTWSKWVKPVLFAFLSSEDLQTEAYGRSPEWRVPLTADTAVIADLPEAVGVAAGVVLSRAGYRPIPIYNASPFATDESGLDARAIAAAVDLRPVLSALCGRAKELAAAGLPAGAPPVFLLDANRMGHQSVPGDWWFDNRSFVTTTDFPSADFFRRQGISRIVVVQERASQMQADLRQVLLGLQGAGMKIAPQAPWESWEPQPITVRGLPILALAWETLRRVFVYRKDRSGVFGGLAGPGSS